jgi:hypothetical protein
MIARQMIQQDGTSVSELRQRTFLVLHEDEYVTSYEAQQHVNVDDVVFDVFTYCNAMDGGEFQRKDLTIWRGDGRLSAVIHRKDDGTSQVTRFA